MEEEILKYYSKFKEIYNEENYPKWFAFCNDHNKQFGDEGYKLGVSGHELKHFAILQTKIYEQKEIIIVGNNNSWFVPGNMRESLKVVKGLKEGIPEDNFLTKDESDYSRDLRSYFEILGEDSKKLFERAIGINRFWIQTGPKCPPKELNDVMKMDQPNIEEMKRAKKLRKEWNKLQENCEKWTREIIELINPQLLLLLSGAAQKLYPEGSHNNGFWVQHCPAPSFKRYKQKLKPDYFEFKSLDELERFKAIKIKNGLEQAGLI